MKNCSIYFAMFFLFATSGVSQSPRSGRGNEPSKEALFKMIVAETQRPGYHLRDTVYVSIEFGSNVYIYWLRTGKLAYKRPGTIKKKWECGDYVEVLTNIIDRNLGQSQGAAQLWKREGKRWKRIATAEGDYQLEDLRKARVPQSVLDCLEIEGF